MTPELVDDDGFEVDLPVVARRASNDPDLSVDRGSGPVFPKDGLMGPDPPKSPPVSPLALVANVLQKFLDVLETAHRLGRGLSPVDEGSQ
jgi:hypothetical protein